MRAGAVFVLLVCAAPFGVSASVQRAIPDPVWQQVTAGETAVVTLSYDTDATKATGFGVRLHYDSSKLLLDHAEVLLAAGLVATQDQLDFGNADGDLETDRQFLAAWVALTEAWPGPGVDLPVELLRLHFVTYAGYQSTQVNVTGITCAACTFAGEPATIDVISIAPGFSPTSPVAIPAASNLGLGLVAVALAGSALALLRRR